MGTEEFLIEVKDLTKTYGRKKAIDRLSFNVQKGEVVGFLGPNGAGKSTTMRILCGLMPASSGEATVCGIPLASHSREVKKYVGYMPENNPLPTELRVDEYLRFRGQLKGLEGSVLRRRVDEVLELCDLRRSAEQRIIGNLSKGYRQRVGIAEALVAEPRLVVMDEPTIGLDPHQVKIIRKLIERLRGEKTFFVSSHILSEVETSCDRVLIINHGRIVAEGSLNKLREKFAPEVLFEVYVAGEPEDILKEILKVNSSIEKLEEGKLGEDGFQRVLFRAERNKDVTEQVAIRLAKSGKVRLREIRAAEPDLEEIFMRATQRSWEVETPLGPIQDKFAKTEQGETESDEEGSADAPEKKGKDSKNTKGKKAV
ncbi:MAG: ABC transporter [Opitutae bacterium]|nr:ABC transporter [Opitutae bacterium]|tara:strand:+ start:585 stop:1694 length:1110 start_codon:yes stop_codon:yes gene_type:complete